MTAELSESDRHRLLAAERRRLALDVLADRTAPVDLEDLATAISAREADAPPRPTYTDDRVAITLHHQHLPMLDEAGVVDYDPASRRVVSIGAISDVIRR